MKMAPSILSADFMNLGHDVRAVCEGGADWVHVDVMDGHFVPNLTLGVPFVKALKGVASSPLDVHLMISNPAVQVPWYLQAGADGVTIHWEACESVEQCRQILQVIGEAGAVRGLSVNPETDVRELEPLLDCIDLALVMSVHPGFGGQSFIESSIDKVAWLDAQRMSGYDFLIEVDGGINEQTAKPVAAAGADVLVAGSAVFAKPDPVQAMEAIRASAQAAVESAR